jgi:hypothetical protein
MENFEDGFVEVKKNQGAIYEPCTRKDDTGETVNKKATDKSWLVGYYLGMREVQTQSGTSNMHDFQFKACGDSGDLSQEVEEGAEVSMWGRTTLDDLLNKNVPIGTLCRVLWEGKVENKSKTRKFHSFKVAVKESDTLSNISQQTSPKPIVEEKVESPKPVNAAASLDDDDDDDPFA